MAKKVEKPVEESKELVEEVAEKVTEAAEVVEEESVEEVVEEPVDDSQGFIDERILLRRIILDNPGAPVFAIIRDTLDDSDPERWNSVIRRWVNKDYFIVIPPGNDIRDGYLSETGRLYAKVTYNI